MSKCFAYSQHKRITPDDRLSLLHSLGFAASHGNLLVSLLNGAALYPFDIKSAGVLQFAEWLKDERIPISHMPVMVFRELAEGLRNDNGLESLRIIYLSGAPSTKQDFDLYKGLFSASTQLEIGMGSTETGHICLAMLDKSFSFPEEGTPLGYPLPGKRVFLIDEYGKEVGSNEIGEIKEDCRKTGASAQAEGLNGEWFARALSGFSPVQGPGRRGRSVNREKMFFFGAALGADSNQQAGP